MARTMAYWPPIGPLLARMARSTYGLLLEALASTSEMCLLYLNLQTLFLKTVPERSGTFTRILLSMSKGLT